LCEVFGVQWDLNRDRCRAYRDQYALDCHQWDQTDDKWGLISHLRPLFSDQCKPTGYL